MDTLRCGFSPLIIDFSPPEIMSIEPLGLYIYLANNVIDSVTLVDIPG